MTASPTRNALTLWSRISFTSSGLRMPLSVTTRLPAGMLGKRSSVFFRLVSKVRRLRLLMPSSGVFMVSATSSSRASCTSTSTSMPSSIASVS
ncbi:hypothetical protein G6F57_022979 [Rhizopus arrhizus]|nr:hypothetical protein G6F57_022979 [Rhizopus arrhizus]